MANPLPSYAELMKHKTVSAPSSDIPSYDDLVKHSKIIPEQETLGTNIKDTLIGGAQGATLGFGGELLAGAQSAIDVATSDKKLEDLYSLYRKHQKENEDGINKARERSPYLVGGGEIAGAIVPGILSGGLTAPITGGMEAANLGRIAMQGAIGSGIAGAGYSENNIENLPKLIEDTATGALIGGVAGPVLLGGMKLGKAALTGVSNKLQPIIKDNTILSKLDHVIKKGVKKEGLFGVEAEQSFLDKNEELSKKLAKDLIAPQDMTAKEYIKAYEESVASGTTISDFKNIHEAFADNIRNSGENVVSSIPYNNRKSVKELLYKISSGEANISEVKELEKTLRSIKISPGKEFDQMADLRQMARSATDDMLPENVQALLNTRFSNSRNPSELLINKGQSDWKLQKLHATDMYSDEQREKIEQTLEKKILPKLYEGTTGGGESRKLFKDFLESVDTSRAISPDLAPDVRSMLPEIENLAKDTGAYRDITGNSLFGAKDFQSSLFGTGGYGSAYYGGRAVGKVASISQFVYKLPKQGLIKISNHISQYGGTTGKSMGRALNSALESNNQSGINAILFSIVQNPALRQSIEPLKQQIENDNTTTDIETGRNVLNGSGQ